MMKNKVVLLFLCCLAWCFASCHTPGETSSSAGAKRDSTHTEAASTQSNARLTKDRPDYYGVFYIGPDSLIEMRKGQSDILRVSSPTPQFYVYGFPAYEIPIYFQNSSGGSSYYYTRVHPVKNSLGDMVLDVQLPPRAKLPPGKYWLGFGDGIFRDDRYQFSVVEN